MNVVILSGLAGLGAGGIMILLTHLALARHSKHSRVRDLDRLRLLGRTYGHRESHVIGIIIHLILYGVAGVVYGSFVRADALAATNVIHLAGYAGALTLAFGGVILPLEGHGLFGIKEDDWFVADLLITNVIWAMLFGAIMLIAGA